MEHLVSLTPGAIALLALAAGVAGFIDAIAGGGGLITVPALALAGLDPLSVLATNKLQSTFGSGSATLAFARAGFLAWRNALPIGLAAAAGSLVGTHLVTILPMSLAQVLLPVMLVAVGLYFALSPRMGDADAHQRLSRPVFLATAIPAVGLYDGVFGPGAGSIYTLAFVTLLGFGIVRATAHTKVANFASNLASLATFALGGHILWQAGLAMGVAQFLGARLGAHATLRRGARLVRPLVVLVCLTLALRIAYQNLDAIRTVLHL